MSPPPKTAKEIFLVALDTERQERAALLDVECAGDAALRRQVEALLQVHDEPDSLLDSPRIDVGISDVAFSEAPERSTTEQPGDTIGFYKLLQQIGEGGMGVVYMAEQTEPVERRVALKIIKPGMDTRKVIARFETERQALAMMDHPNIAKVYDAGTTDTGRPYFVMELVKGVPITQYCDEQKLSPRERLELFVSVCQAVQHAHQKGIIHRDIKPPNVLVAEYDDRPVPKIIDFGVAKAIEQRLSEKTVFTEFGQVVGTPEYMSPEQARLNQHDIDTRTDVYSLGVLLYELLTGETPFDRERLRSAAFDELLRIIREEEPPRPSLRLSTSESLPSIAANRHVEPKKLSALIHGELDWIVMKALEKDRARRYDTASKFAEDVQHYLSDEAVEAWPPSAAYKLRKFARRNKPMIVTTTTIATALVIGTAVATWQAIQANRERNRAVAAEVKALEEAERADAEAAVAKAVNDFLQTDLLGMAAAESQVKAKVSPDPHIELRTLLDRAAESVGERFKDRPHVEAAIRHTIGNAYYSIGEYSKAEEQLQQEVEIRRKAAEAEDPAVLLSMNNLANVYYKQGRYAEAEKLYRQTLEIYRRVLGEEHRDTLGSMDNLANVYLNQGRYEEAEKLLRQTLEIHRRVLGEEHRDTLGSMDNLANVYLGQSRYAEAEKLHRQTLEICRRVLGKEHPRTLGSMNNLANVYLGQGRYDEAEKLYRQTLEIRRRVLGEEHPDTLGSMDNLANVYFEQVRYDEAEKLHRQTLEICRRVLGEEHPDTLKSMNNLANVYYKQRRYAEAEKLHRQTLEIRRRVLGKEHPRTLGSMNNLANVYIDQGRYAEAEKLHRQTLEIFRRVLGEKHPYTLESMSNLALVYRDQGRYEEAEALQRQILEISRRTFGAEYHFTRSALRDLVACYVKESWQLATSSDLSKRDPEKAVQAARAAVELAPDNANAWNKLGVALYRNERWKEATETLEKAREMGSREDPVHEFFLAMAYWQSGQPENALANYKEAAVWMFEDDRGDEARRLQTEAEQLIPAEEIARYCHELIKEDGPTAELLAVSAAALVRLGRRDAAAKEYAQVVPLLLETDNPWWGTIAGSNTPAIQSDEIYQRLSLLLPDHRVLRIARVHYLAARGRWEELTEQLQAAIQLDPTDQLGWYNIAAVQLYVGNSDAYRRTCRELLARFADAGDAGTFERGAKTCLLSPDGAGQLALARLLADRAVAISQDAEPWSCLAKSLGDYRGGDFESAITYAKKSRPPETPYAYRDATALLVQAMAQHQLDRTDEAAQSLAEAQEIMNQHMPTPETGELDRSWPDWLRFHTLRREAESLIEPKDKADNEQSQSEQEELSKN